MGNIPTINDHPQYVTQPEDKAPVIPADAVRDHGLKLSKNMKLAMRHIDFKEKAIPVSDEWKWVDGQAVPPAGRDTSVSYTASEANKYSSYGNVTVTQVKPFNNDPSNEMCDTIVVTAPTTTTNDDPTKIEAIPVIAVENKQFNGVLTEGRHGEVEFDPISRENYLTRPGMEVKTSTTYMGKDTYTCTVTLEKNGGTLAEGQVDVTSYVEGTEVTLPLLVKDSSTFDGWFDNAEFTGTAVTKIAKTSTGDVKFYAKFSAVTARKTTAAKKTTTEA